MVRLFRLLCLLVACLALAPGRADAQRPEWQEKRTAHFAITHVAAQRDEGERYARFVDEVYTDLSAIFGLSISTPVTLRLFPDEQSYVAVNPLAARMPGVIAHATSGRGRREIAIAVERTRGLPEEMIVNNVRHELTHLIIAQMTDDNLPVGWHEGVAQYLERPVQREQEQIIRRLRQARSTNGFLSWADLNAPGGAYSNAEIAYPQSYSMVAFLVDRYGFAKLVEFLKAMPQSAGYRSALETVYGVSADQLEAQWKDYLPEFIEGRYRINALYAYDLAPARALLAQGAYTAVKEDVERAVHLLRTTNQTERLAEAEAMLARAERGIAAGQIVAAARAALEARDYEHTRALVARAQSEYRALNDSRRDEELRLYDERATEAMQALEQLYAAQALAAAYRYPEARAQIIAAAGRLGALGDTAAYTVGEQLMAEMDQKQRQVAYGFLGVAALLFVLNIRRRWVSYADPQRGWF
jgi:hypothetical protein